jgi:hypothetical protein
MARVVLDLDDSDMDESEFNAIVQFNVNKLVHALEVYRGMQSDEFCECPSDGRDLQCNDFGECSCKVCGRDAIA